MTKSARESELRLLSDIMVRILSNILVRKRQEFADTAELHCARRELYKNVHCLPLCPYMLEEKQIARMARVHLRLCKGNEETQLLEPWVLEWASERMLIEVSKMSGEMRGESSTYRRVGREIERANIL